MPENPAVQLEEMIRIAIRDKMGPDPSGQLDAMTLGDLVIHHLNWTGRRVGRRPRRAHLSTPLTDSRSYRDNRNLVDAVAAEIEAGDDLHRRLSTRVETAYEPVGQRDARNQRRRDLDLLLAEWGIHHLHISDTMDPGGLFVTRSDLLLFVKFTPDDAYLIQLLPHGDWTNRTLFEICVRDWPDAQLFPASLSGLTLAQTVTEDEAKRERNAGISALMEVDGVLYFSPGQTTTGIPMDAVEQSNTLMHRLHGWEQAIADGPALRVRIS